eukprot:gene8669-6848_t
MASQLFRQPPRVMRHHDLHGVGGPMEGLAPRGEEHAFYLGPEFDGALLNVGQALLNVGQALLNVGQALLNVGQALFIVEQMLLNVGQAVLNVEQALFIVEQMLLNVGQAAINAEHAFLSVGRALINVGQVILNPHSAAPVVHDPSRRLPAYRSIRLCVLPLSVLCGWAAFIADAERRLAAAGVPPSGAAEGDLRLP